MSRDQNGLLESLASVGANLFSIVQNRIELAGIELAEARTRLLVMAASAFAAALLFCAAAITLTAWIAALLWPVLGSAVLGWITLVYALVGAGILLWLRGKLRTDPPILGDTRAELKADAAYMRGESLPRHLNDNRA